jgi:DNA polymerase III delta prime subunit
MIGQKKNLETIKKWRMNRSFPRFIIISGDKGSGRYTLAKEMVNVLNSSEYVAGIGIDDVREVIRTAYTVRSDIVYIFRDCDDMSLAAKNSLLKVVEEPPENARFVMTVADTANVLPTILSRATVLHMSPYTLDELDLAQNELNLSYMIKSISDKENKQFDAIQRAVELCENVLIYVSKKSMLGALKELNKLRAKVDGEGVDPELFVRAFRHNIADCDIPADALELFVPHIVKCSGEMKRSSNNKKASIEVMVINIIEEYKNYVKAEV